MANDAIARKHPMNDMKKITDYEIAVERRLEKACERDGWVASAHVSFGADYVDCQLEKFGREEVWVSVKVPAPFRPTRPVRYAPCAPSSG